MTGDGGAEQPGSHVSEQVNADKFQINEILAFASFLLQQYYLSDFSSFHLQGVENGTIPPEADGGLQKVKPGPLFGR